jgi:hypothetical protein
MKHAKTNTQFGFFILYFMLCIFLVLFSACGDSSDTSHDTFSETGAIAFNVELVGGAEFDCDFFGVDYIWAEVYDDNNSLLAEGGPWDCKEGEGTITGVEAGENRRVVLLGKDDSGFIIVRGEATVTVIAGQTTDAGTITLIPDCRPPVLDPIGPQSVDEDELLEFTITATDPDPDDVLTYSASNLPNGATFDPETQIFRWTPGYEDEGNYQVLFTVTDNCVPPQSDFEEVTITVGDICRPPVLNPIGPQSVDEDELLEFIITATDPDPDDVLTYSASNLPNDATFDPQTQTFIWTPGYEDEGNYQVLFTVTDDCDPPQSDFEEVTITVGDICRPPVLNPIGDKTVTQWEELLEFTITATDPDPGDVLTYSADLSNLPTYSYPPSFDTGTQTFSWYVYMVENGNYQVRFTVTDDCDPPLSDFEDVTIRVNIPQ